MRHGGDLGEAEKHYGTADWLDLSTGINPRAWPIAECDLATMALDRLPAQAALDGLLAAARSAYGVSSNLAIAATPGTEFVIRALPFLCGDLCQIAPTSYASYASAWENAGRPLSHLRQSVSVNVDPSASVILVNPNNPDGRTHPPHLLHAIARSRRDHALLVIDEAYADVEEGISLVPLLQADDRAIVLKSFGKFFGLPGLRLGFVIGHRPTIEALKDRIGDWPVSAPALAIGTRALLDRAWQTETRNWLPRMAEKLELVLKDEGLSITGGTPLFRLVATTNAHALHAELAQRGVWTRRFEDRPNAIRIGIPPDLAGLDRFRAALKASIQKLNDRSDPQLLVRDEITG